MSICGNNELEKPPISKEKGAVEILRVWGGDHLPQQYSLKTTWDNPAAWGFLLVDIAKHAAKAYSRDGQVSEQEALRRIKEGLDAEWNFPTDEPEEIK